MRVFYSWYLLTILFLVPLGVICWSYALISAHVKKVSKSFNKLGSRHPGGRPISIRKKQFNPTLDGNKSPMANGSDVGFCQKIPPSPVLSLGSIRLIRDGNSARVNQPTKVESDRCTDRHLNMVILFFVLGVVICWVPYHVFQLLVSAMVYNILYIA